MHLTSKETREKVENHISSYFANNTIAGTENSEDVCDLLAEIANDGEMLFGKDWLINVDHWGNVADWVAGEAMISYHSKILNKAIVIHPMFETSHVNVHFLALALIEANDEALRTEQRLEILNNA